MRLDSGNRSFLALLGVVLVPYVLLGVFGCGLLSLLVYRLGTHGIAGLQQGGDDLRPAAVFFALVSTGTLIGALSIRRQLRATRQLARLVSAHTAALPDEVERVAERVGLGGRVDVLDDAQPCSFTYGVFSPRVTVSRGLAEAMDTDELEAVLQHERYHVRNLDTLKVVVARAAASAFFFLPAVRHLRDRYLAGRELAADRRAVRALGERPLAAALCKVIDGPTFANLGAAAALGGSEFLAQRVEQLESGHEPAMSPLPRRVLWGTAAGLSVLTGAFALTLANGGGNAMAMDDSMAFRGPMGTVASVVGGAACVCAWLVVAVVVARRGMRHRPAG